MQDNGVVILDGDPYERGFGQKNQRLTKSVEAAIAARLDKLELNAYARDFLKQQWDIAQLMFEDQVAEINGIADAYNMAPERIFSYLNATIIEEAYPTAIVQDGCSVWAISQTSKGPIVCKNRDYRGEHKNVQAAFIHRHPDIPGGEYFTIGSYGSPGGFSSGINAAGVAIADTQIPTTDHGVGIIRYLLINKLLCEANSTMEAINLINSLPQAGGGSLTICDPSGDVAIVEIGHTATQIERSDHGYNFRTNHFLSSQLKSSYFNNKNDKIRNTSTGRLSRMATDLDDFDILNPIAESKKLLSSHDNDTHSGLCSHGNEGSTLSGAIYLCAKREVIYSHSNPCQDRWNHIKLNTFD